MSKKLKQNLLASILFLIASTIYSQGFGFDLTDHMVDLGFCKYFLKPGSMLGIEGNFQNDFYRGGIGVSGSFDINHPAATADTFHRFNIGSHIDFATFDYFAFNYLNRFSFSEFYTGNLIRIKPFPTDSIFRSIYGTVEWFTTPEFKTYEFMTSLGLETHYSHPSKSYVMIEPYLCFGGYNFENLNFIPGIDTQLCGIFFNHLGITQNTQFRYAVLSTGNKAATTALYSTDYFRAKKHTEENPIPLTFSEATEIFFHTEYFDFTIIKIIHITDVQVGAFFDSAYNNQWNFCTGGFGRLKVSLNGHRPFWGEGALGYNQVTNKILFSVGIKDVY